MPDDATLEILIKWKQENERVVAEVQAQLAGLTAQTMAATAATNAATAAAAGGLPAWAGIALAVGAATVVLWPFVVLVGSATVALISFAVGAAGFLVTAGLVAGAFAAIGAAVVGLGVIGLGGFTATTGPVAKLVSDFQAMTKALEAQAAPLAAIVVLWADKWLPIVGQIGSSIMSWFGERLPGVLQGLSKVIRDLTPDFISFGQYFGTVMDKIGPTLAPIAEAFARLALQGARGLLDNLVRLSDWFLKELPFTGPIVQSIFAKIGDAVQWVASNWASLTDFVEKKWPVTVKNAQDSLRDLSKWWETNGGTIQTFTGNVLGLMDAFNKIIGVWVAITNLLNGVGLGPNKFFQAINDIAGLIRTTTQEGQDLLNVLSRLAGQPGTNYISSSSSYYSRGRGFTGGRLG